MRRADRLFDRKVAIRTVRDHLLAPLKMQIGTIEMDRDNVWLERDQVEMRPTSG